MRADRLIQTLLLLQGRQVITAAELARELEVSVPTARRDLEALSMAGVPVYSTRGRGGGWRLVGGARTDLTGLTETELTSLLIGLAQNASRESERVAAMRKLMRAAPAPFRESAQRVADATVLEGSWGEVRHDTETAPVAQLQRAVASRQRVRMQYAGSRGAVSAEVVPLVLGSRGSHWYLLAAPVVDEGPIADVSRIRTYRVDRIEQLDSDSRSGVAPDDFDAQSAWARMTARVEGLRGAVHATVAVEPWAVRAVLDRFGEQAKMLEVSPQAGGRAVMEVSAQHTEALAEQLAGWTSALEVIEPQEVRAALSALGQRIMSQYANE